MSRLPPRLIPKGGTPTFVDDSIPAGLLRDHQLAEERWGVLHLLDGEVVFVDQGSGGEMHLIAPQTHIILPKMMHHLRVVGPVECRVDFFWRGNADGPTPLPVLTGTPAVLDAGPTELVPLFAAAFTERVPSVGVSSAVFPREALFWASVSAVLSAHEWTPDLLRTLERCGDVLGREGAAFAPRHYSAWVEAVCSVVAARDPAWTTTNGIQMQERLRLAAQSMGARF